MWSNRHGYIWRGPTGTDMSDVGQQAWIFLTWTNRHGYMSDVGQQARIFLTWTSRHWCMSDEGQQARMAWRKTCSPNLHRHTQTPLQVMTISVSSHQHANYPRKNQGQSWNWITKFLRLMMLDSNDVIAFLLTVIFNCFQFNSSTTLNQQKAHSLCLDIYISLSHRTFLRVWPTRDHHQGIKPIPILLRFDSLMIVSFGSKHVGMFNVIL